MRHPTACLGTPTPLLVVLLAPARTTRTWLASLALALLLAPAPVHAASLVFTPDADARVVEASPVANFGVNSLGTDGGSGARIESLLRFTVAGVTGPVQSAKLRLYAVATTVDGPAVSATSPEWLENTVTWQTRPQPIGTAVADVGAIASSTWVELDVTALVPGDGTHAFVLTQESTDSVQFSSREATRPPQLVVTWQAPAGGTETVKLLALADARVVEATPGSNFGGSSRLNSDGGSGAGVESVIAFDLGVLQGTVVDARLVLRAAGSTVDGPAVYGTLTTWSETGVTWSQRPPPITLASDDAGAIQSGTLASWNVASLLPNGGPVAFLLAQPGTDSVAFLSRESAEPPALILTLQPDSGACGVCDDGNPCTDDVCDPEVGCVAKPSSAPCDADGDLCTFADACKDGTCQAGTAISCEDGNVCTADACQPTTGACVHATDGLDGSACGAGAGFCTNGDACQAGACVAGSAITCDDGDACSLDWCNPLKGCVFEPSGGPGCATTFERAYGGAGDDKGVRVIATADGGQLMVGRTSSFGAGGTDMLVVKSDACGNVQWQRAYGGSGNEAAEGAIATADGGYLLIGESRTWPGALLVRITSDGEVLWSASYGGGGYDAGKTGIALADGNYAILAETYSIGPGTPQYHNTMILKVTDAGALLWSRVYGGAIEGDAAYDLLEVEDAAGAPDGLLVAGAIESYSLGNDDVWLLRLEADGAHRWSIGYGSGEDDEARAVMRAADGGFVITGFTRSMGAVLADAFLLKTDAQGNLQWSTRHGGADDDEGHGVVALGSGYLVSGFTRSFGAGSKDFFLLATDAVGKLLWYQTFGGKNGDEATSMARAADGGVLLGGASYSYKQGTRDFFLIKTDSDGGGVCHGQAIDMTLVSTAKVESLRNDFEPIGASGAKKSSAAAKATASPGSATLEVCGCL